MVGRCGRQTAASGRSVLVARSSPRPTSSGPCRQMRLLLLAKGFPFLSTALEITCKSNPRAWGSRGHHPPMPAAPTSCSITIFASSPFHHSFATEPEPSNDPEPFVTRGSASPNTHIQPLHEAALLSTMWNFSADTRPDAQGSPDRFRGADCFLLKSSASRAFKLTGNQRQPSAKKMPAPCSRAFGGHDPKSGEYETSPGGRQK